MNNKKIVQKIVLSGVIKKGDKILILQRHKDEKVFPEMWELPSGKREFLEPSKNSLIREIKEETNLDTELIMPVSVFDYQIEKTDEIKDSTQINFLVRPTDNKEVKISDEHMTYAWIKKDEIYSFNLTEETKKVILEAFNLIEKLSL